MTGARFTCEPLHCRMSVAACVAVRAKALRKRVRLELRVETRCASCSVGAAHARGELAARWDDGGEVERTQT